MRGRAAVEKALIGEGQKKTLFLDDLKVQLVKDRIQFSNNFNKFSLWLRNGLLRVRVSNIEGVEKFIPINAGGHFRVFSRLIQYNSNTGEIDSLDEISYKEAPRVVLSSEGLISHSLDRQVSDEHFRMKIYKEFHRNWDDKKGWLALKVHPLNFPFGSFF